jgi:hypothetical protein
VVICHGEQMAKLHHMVHSGLCPYGSLRCSGCWHPWHNTIQPCVSHLECISSHARSWAIDREPRIRDTPTSQTVPQTLFWTSDTVSPTSRMMTQHNRDSSTYTSDIKRIRRHPSDIVRPASPTITQRIVVLTPMRTFERKYEVSTVVIA